MPAFLLTVAVPVLFGFLVLYGALNDLSTFRIPNWVSYGLVGLFFLYWLLIWVSGVQQPSNSFTESSFLVNLSIGLLTLVVSMVFWRLGYIGGGDAKYLAAITLWMGPIIAVQFMIAISGLALLMALGLKLSADWGFLVHEGRFPAFLKRVYARYQNNQVPFGFPIGIAALLMIPQIFDL
jgi:prepilin peptidase CpaA